MHDPKATRLMEEYQKLLKLERRSKFIEVEPVDVQPGYPPEKYRITYTCLGIARIKPDGEPVPAETHRMEMILIDFPAKEPVLKWLTPIWHPNIEHDGLRKVCTDNPKSWFPTKSLDWLVITMGEMVQYKQYHAKWEPPYPVDKAAAQWVIGYAEPRNIVGPGKPFDPRPLLRKMPLAPAGGPRPETSSAAAPGAKKKPRVVFGKLEREETPRPHERVKFGKLTPDK